MRPGLGVALWVIATAVAVVISMSAIATVMTGVSGSPADLPLGADAMLPTTAEKPTPTGPNGTSPGTSPSPAPPAASPSPAPPAASPSPAPSPASSAAETRTVSVIGGTAAVRFAGGRVEVLWATPNDGFTVTVEPEPAGVEVDFRSDGHRSRIKAEYEDGVPRVRTEERPD